MNKVGPIVGAKAPGSLILVEMLLPQEAANTVIYIDENTKVPPQGYILDVGPLVKEDWGFKVGDRVLLQGTYTPVPSFERENSRKLGIIQPTDIKAVLVEG